MILPAKRLTLAEYEADTTEVLTPSDQRDPDVGTDLARGCFFRSDVSLADGILDQQWDPVTHRCFQKTQATLG